MSINIAVKATDTAVDIDARIGQLRFRYRHARRRPRQLLPSKEQ